MVDMSGKFWFETFSLRRFFFLVGIVPLSMAERVRVVQLGEEEALGKLIAALQYLKGVHLKKGE